VLGLTPNDPNSLPIIKGVQNGDPGKLAFALGNVTYNADSGVKVTYKVNEYTALNSDVFLERGSTNAGEVIEFSLPTEGILHYYRAVIEYSN